MKRARERVHSRREWPVTVDWEARAADRVDPVFAGDVLDAAGSGWLQIALGLIGFALIRFALGAAPAIDDGSATRLRDDLAIPLIALRALLLGVLPFRTFLKVRGDLQAGNREPLLLAGLDPLQIVRGRIAGGLALAGIGLGLTAPCVAATVALRGLPLAPALSLLALAVLVAIGAQALATGLAAATRGIRLQAIPIAGAGTIFALLGYSHVDEWRSTFDALAAWTDGGLLAPVAYAALLTAAVTVTAVLLAIAALRPDERRSGAAFRWLAIATPLLLAAADLLLPGALPAVATPSAPGVLVVAWTAFVGVTAIDRPRGGLARPFADGPDRALVWLLLALGIVEAAAAIVARGAPPPATHLAVATTLGYALVARLVAATLGAGTGLARLRAARVRAGIAVLATLALPRLWNGLVGAPSDAWVPLAVVDPWRATARLIRDGAGSLPWLAVTAVLATLTLAWLAFAWRGRSAASAAAGDADQPEGPAAAPPRAEPPSGPPSAPPAGSPAGSPPGPGAAPRRRDWSDWIHPVLVRDVRRTLRSEVHAWSVLLGTVLVIGIALAAADRQLAGRELARFIVLTTIRALIPLVLFAIPLQAFLTLREEVSATTADQLLLAGMRPTSVVGGMVLTAVLQSVVLVALFAPLLAFCYPLFGVDLRTLLQVLWMAPLACAVVTTVGFATLSLGHQPGLRPHLGMIALGVLGGVTALAWQGAAQVFDHFEANARSRDFWLIAQQQWTVCLLLTLSLGLVGAGALTHVRETATVSVRLLGLAAAPTLTLLSGAGVPGATIATFATLPFWFLATTAPLALQRRELALVPQRPRDAMLRAPLLPGCGRGIVYTLCMAAGLLGFGLLTHQPFHGATPTAAELLHLLAAVGLMITWGTAIAIHRMRGFDQSRATTSKARLHIPAIAFFLLLGAALLDGAARFSAATPALLLSTFNPLVLLFQPQLLLPIPLVAFATCASALALLWSARDLLRFSFAELRAPGRVEVPARYRGAGGGTGRGARRGRAARGGAPAGAAPGSTADGTGPLDADRA